MFDRVTSADNDVNKDCTKVMGERLHREKVKQKIGRVYSAPSSQENSGLATD
jgi:hypothetical protein